MISVGSDFSGVGAFDQALIRLGIKYNTVFACDMDKYARQTYVHNYGEPDYFPMDVYDREIPTDPLDIYMTSPPCQAFSLAGKRKGEDDKRGILFYNSHEFIQKNNPRFFIFENVKGLLSDANGNTFRTWVEYLGGKSINGNPVLFPHPESAPYHIYWKVLNAKNYGIPQNRERVFIVGIRDDVDNDFTWPKEIFLEKRLRDVLEKDVDEKYFLSDKMINGFIRHAERHKEKGNGFSFDLKKPDDISNAITTCEGSRGYNNFVPAGYINQDTQASQVYSDSGISPSICAGTHGYANGYIEAGRITGRNPENPKSRKSGLPTEQMLEVNEDPDISNTLTTVQKDNVVVENWIRGGLQQNQPFQTNGISPCLTSAMGMGGGQTPVHNYDCRIRKLTPRECFRLMDFDDSFTWPVSDRQAYKQAGNSICVGVLAAIIERLRL